MGTRIEVVNVAKIVRKVLAKHFPKTKFSVRSKKYSGGSSIDVDWANGPTQKEVDDKIAHFHGAEFDGMQDLKYYNERPYANDFIFTHRTITEDHYKTAAQEIISRYSGCEHLSLENMDKGDSKLMNKWSRWTLREMAFHHILKDKNLTD